MSADLSRHPIHLGRGATAVAEPEFTGFESYEGYMRRHAEIGGREVRTTLRPGEYAINPPGVWHTADVGTRATAKTLKRGYSLWRPRCGHCRVAVTLSAWPAGAFGQFLRETDNRCVRASGASARHRGNSKHHQ